MGDPLAGRATVPLLFAVDVPVEAVRVLRDGGTLEMGAVHLGVVSREGVSVLAAPLPARQPQPEEVLDVFRHLLMQGFVTAAQKAASKIITGGN